MSYQVLARKWRPKSFATLVGQEHVVRALTHALDQQRLHHAYLFTGTRGVGKTTLARLLAKALNCIGPDGQGAMTSSPCGVCRACTEIDAGRFVDYIEMDAASNRGVDEMAQLLEQAVYAPSNARFKVYMIDEVHMLTSHAFNAMLKTLEEPPDYVKFILATTDPQKIPVTVLSRCLQFNLKQMPIAQIVPHLEQVLKAEQVAFEAHALPLLARGAAGSMRDALSLTDQAIAFSGGKVTEHAVREMLGSLDETYLIRILEALIAGEGQRLLAVADEIAQRSLSYNNALQDLAGLLHRIAVLQAVPGASLQDGPDAVVLETLAQQMSPEEVQLHYEIATRGRSELGLAPDEYAGFTMTLLRMLAFRPAAPDATDTINPSGGAASSDRASNRTGNRTSDRASDGPTRTAHPGTAAREAAGGPAARPQSLADDAQGPAARGAEGRTVGQTAGQTAGQTSALMAGRAPTRSSARTSAVSRPDDLPRERAALESPPPAPAVSAADPAGGAGADHPVFDGDWLALTKRLKLTGLARQLAEQAELAGFEDGTFHLRVPIKSLLEPSNVEKLRAALRELYGPAARIKVELGAVQGATAAAAERGERARRQAAAVASIEEDPFVRALVKDFGATIVPGSIKPAQ